MDIAIVTGGMPAATLTADPEMGAGALQWDGLYPDI